MVTQQVLSADTLSSASPGCSGGCWSLAVGTKVSPVTNTLCTLDTLVRSCGCVCVWEGGGGEGEGRGTITCTVNTLTLSINTFSSLQS